MPVQFTTELPDEDQPVLGNGVEDEVAVDRESAVSDYGSVRIQIRETGQSSWDSNATGFGEFIGNYDTLTMEFVGREDGEEYEVRARTETEHVTGAWTTPVSIVTKFPGVTSLAVTGSAQTSVDLEATDNADNEDGVRIQRQREYDSGWGPWQTAVDVGPHSGTGTVTFTDDTVSPGNTYRFRVEAYTEHTAGVSNETSSVTTPSSGRPRTRTSASGWTVEVDHPSGRTLRPRLLDDPEANPRVNDLPRVRIPVPKDEKWQAEAFEEAEMRVWEDGQKQPIGTLVDVEQQPDRSILIGEGGRELKQPIEAEYDLEDIHIAAGDLIEANTSYAADVDAPTESYRKDVLQKVVDSESDWLNDLNSAIADDEPWRVTSDGRLARKQTSWTREGETSNGPDGTESFEGYSGLDAEILDSLYTHGPWSFSPAYDIPSNSARIALRIDLDSDYANPAFTIYLNGAEVTQFPAGSLLGGMDWQFISVNTSIAAGTHTIEIEVTEQGSEPLYLDLVNIHDTRFSYDFPDTNNGIGGPLDGPQDYPGPTSRELSDVSVGQQVVGGRLDATIDDTTGGQAVAISNDQGQSWLTAQNTTVVDGEFADAGSRIRARFTLDRYGSRTDETPATGFQTQSVDLYELYADLDETPVVINQSKDDHLDRVLRDFADQGDFIWEYRLDETGDPTVVWTQPGQRVNSDELELADYTVSKRSGAIYEQVTVVGSPQTVRSEQFTANVGTAVDLAHTHLVDGSETVIDPANPGQTFERNVDYDISYLDGTITVLSAGSMSDGTTYEVDYQYETRGSYALDSAADPREAPQQTIPGLTSPQACQQAAITIVNEVSEPLWDVQLTVPPREVGFNVSEALALPQLPTDGPVEVRDVSNSPSEIAIEAGSRESVGEVVQQIQERVGQVSRRS